MSKVDLISQEWCELVFDGRNKGYGAYELRSKAGRRHLLAIIDILIAIAAIAILAFAYQKASEAIKSSMGGENEMVTELSQLKKDEPKKEEPKKTEKPKEEPKPQEQQKEKVAVRQAVAFTAPEIVDNVDQSKKAKSQDELTKSRGDVSFRDYEGDKGATTSLDDLTKTQTTGGTGPGTGKGGEAEPAPEVHNVVEQMPTFPGGEAALQAYVAKHIRYPSISEEQEVQGVIHLKFVVEADGKVGEVKIVKNGCDEHCAKEAIRVVKSLPRFIPGKQQGKPVRVWFSYPIRFQIL